MELNAGQQTHTGKAAIENVNTIYERRSEIVRELLIAICHQTGDKWQSKTLFLVIFDPRLSIVMRVFNCRLPGVRLQKRHKLLLCEKM